MSKVLLCNDNNKILTSVSNILNNNDIEFDLAKSYEVMTDLVNKNIKKNNPYSVVITDINLEEDVNLDVVNKLSSNLPNSTIVAMYSYSDDSIKYLNKETRKNANVLFLKKPFEEIELLQIVQNALNKKDNSVILEQNGSVCDFSTPVKTMLDNISHEIRTPLASIVSITEVLQKTRLTDEQNRHVNSILKCSDTLLNIITDMIDFERVKDNKIEIESKDFNFVDLAEGCVGLVARQAIDKDLDVNISISENVPAFIHSDEAKIRKIIWNIVTNAVKYTNYGNVNVYCDYEESKTKNNLIIKVKDTGIGIDDNSLKDLFNSFENSATPYRSGGSGIGLSMTKRMVDAFNGSIDVTSSVDQGSEFIVTLPVESVYDKSIQLKMGKLTPLNAKHGIFVSTNKLTADAIIGQFAKQNCHLEYADSIRKARNIMQKKDGGLKWCIVDDSLAVQENMPLIKNLVLTCQQNNIKTLVVAKTQSAINTMHKAGISRFINKPCLERDIRQTLTYHSDTAKDSSFAPSLIPMDNIKKDKLLKILVAEDNEVNQMVLTNIIKRLGHFADIAKHGKIAVDKSAMHKYDLALIDLQMPILDGVEAAKLIKNNNESLPIIAMSSNINGDIKQRCEIAGFVDVISKPITEEKLEEIISKFI